MAWSFRRRIKIAPGVHINLSKSGVSTSIGPKGAKVTIGPKGTYLHTGIPGTGLYNRQKIGDAPQRHQQPQSLYSPEQKTSGDPSNNKGCFSGAAIWGIIIICCLCVLGGIVNVNSLKKDRAAHAILIEHQDEKAPLQESIEASGSSLGSNSESRIQIIDNQIMYSYYGIIALSVIAISLLIWVLTKKKSKGTVEIHGLIADNGTLERFQRIREEISKTNDSYKKAILNDYLGHLIRRDAEKRLKPLVDKWTKRVAKNPSIQNEDQLSVINSQYKSATSEADSLFLNLDSLLTDSEKEDYKSFCKAFRAFRNCKKTWIILSKSTNTEYKSSASFVVEKNSVSLKSGCFEFLDLGPEYDVPIFTSLSNDKIYIYPRFVISGNDIWSFDVFPLEKVSLLHKSTRYLEDGFRPSDAKQVDTTYQYVNKNGGPDRRYSYNPTIPILLYGEITLLPFDFTYQVSNNDAAQELETSFIRLKNSALPGLNSGDMKEIDSEEEHPAEIKAFSSIEPKNRIDPFKGNSPEEELVYAANLVVKSLRADTGLISFRLGVNVDRAEVILSELERLGIVGPKNPLNSRAPRPVLVKDLNSLEEIISRQNKKNPGNGVVSKAYFDDLVSAAKRLLEFSNTLSSNLGFAQLVGSSIKGSVNWNGKVLSDPSDLIPVYMWADVIRSYLNLGHDLDLSTNEGLGILVFNTLMIDSTFPIDFNTLDLLRSRLTESSELFTRSTVASMVVTDDVYFLEACLREYDLQLHNTYVVLLYRFASLVAKADKSVSLKEASELNKIIALKVPEEDVPLASPKEVPQKRPVKKVSLKATKSLNALIGLSSVKNEINSLANYIKVQRMREEKGMKVSPVSLHCVFTGPPGTGKTTVARIVSEIYKELGILKKGHLIETDRSGLVAEYVGQTAVKTNKIIDSALDGILFIDEAYSLVDGGNSDYGKEAISTLLKRMEDDRDRLVVILAGYTEDMKRFIDSNPGLQSRFNRYIEFPDYSADELLQIFIFNANKYEYSLTDEAQLVLKDALERVVEKRDKNFGNGRFVRNLFEKVIENQANRLSLETEVTSEKLASIEAEDIRKSL